MTQREGRDFPLDNEKWGNLVWADLLIPGVEQSSKRIVDEHLPAFKKTFY